LAPDLKRNLIEQAFLFEQISELGPKDPGQRLFRQEVVMSGRLPGVAVGCQRTAWDQVVEMWVVAQISSPALHDAHHTEGASEEFGIGSELLEGLVGGVEEQAVEELLMGSGQGS